MFLLSIRPKQDTSPSLRQSPGAARRAPGAAPALELKRSASPVAWSSVRSGVPTPKSPSLPKGLVRLVPHGKEAYHGFAGSGLLLTKYPIDLFSGGLEPNRWLGRLGVLDPDKKSASLCKKKRFPYYPKNVRLPPQGRVVSLVISRGKETWHGFAGIEPGLLTTC